MSSNTVTYLKLVTNQSNIYGGFFVFFTGMIGNILNIIIFTSLKTFRETSAAFYLTATSCVNIFQLVVGLLSRIMITGYNFDPTKTSSFICKGRSYALTTTMLIIFTYMCLASIDQFLSLTHRWRHLCSVKVARHLVIISLIFWCLHGIPQLIWSDVRPTGTTNQTSCVSTNDILNSYTFRFIFPVFLGFLPLIIRSIFVLLAFINVRHLQHRQIPIVRLERDKQLTAMVLVEVLIDVLITLPYSIYNHIYAAITTFSDPIGSAQNDLIIAITRIFFYGNFAISFYIYYCVSSRFRTQVYYVLIEMHLKYWRNKIRRHTENQIAPQVTNGKNVLSLTNHIMN